ncbi:MAG: hypothetical protein GQ565_08195 [Candidatus Aegiribacteria sp.]|nr:hypothetical protein [Candidatus Aegiribacteria sp.]
MLQIDPELVQRPCRPGKVLEQGSVVTDTQIVNPLILSLFYKKLDPLLPVLAFLFLHMYQFKIPLIDWRLPAQRLQRPAVFVITEHQYPDLTFS